MDRLLSVSQAARMVGIPRRLLQQHIQNGQVLTFEGYIRMSELRKAYPDADGDSSGMIEKVKLIREAAALKKQANTSDPERLAADLHQAKIQIAHLQQQLHGYQQLARETKGRLIKMQAQCKQREASLISTLVNWYVNQIRLHGTK